MSLDAVKATSAERLRLKRAHEAKLQRQILDWIEIVRPKSGNVLVLRVPDDKFIWPGTAEEDTTEEQREVMQACQQVLSVIGKGLAQTGTQIAGGAVLTESMKLEDLPPPWEQHPEMVGPGVVVPKKQILLPPGTKV